MQSILTHSAPINYSFPASAPPDQNVWAFPPLQGRSRVANMSGQYSQAQPMRPSTFQGGQGIGGYIATPEDLARQIASISQRNVPTGAYQAASYDPNHGSKLPAMPSTHTAPSTSLLSGQGQIRGPPQQLDGVPSAAYQTMVFTGNIYNLSSAQAWHPKSAQLPVDSRKHFADSPVEKEKDEHSQSASVEPTHLPKKQRSPSNKPSATTAEQTGSKIVPSRMNRPTFVFKKQMNISENLSVTAPAQTVGKTALPSTRIPRVTTRRKTSEERDVTYCDEETDQDEANDQDTPLLSIEGGGSRVVRTRATRAARRQAEANASTTHGQPQGPAAPTYVLSQPLLGLRGAIGEANWKQYIQLVEQFVDQAVNDEQFVRGQRRIFHGQAPTIEKQARRLMEKMVIDGRGVPLGSA